MEFPLDHVIFYIRQTLFSWPSPFIQYFDFISSSPGPATPVTLVYIF